jgi:hypothetical protein
VAEVFHIFLQICWRVVKATWWILVFSFKAAVVITWGVFVAVHVSLGLLFQVSEWARDAMEWVRDAVV